jgi:rfaE bifunctional protein nucleotidyltransferase chain/domain
MSPTMIRDSNFHALLSREDAARRSRIERSVNGRVVFTNGVFDILHRGHLEYLEEARRIGTLLIVGLNSDESVRRIKGPDRPVNSQDDRAYALMCLRFVDHVVIFEEDTPVELIEVIRPHILVKGGDYQQEEVVGSDFVAKTGGKTVILPLREGYSTSGMISLIRERFR